MPEIVPRRGVSRGARLFQVLVAVLAGMASMYCLQNFAAAQKYIAARPQPAVKAAAPEPESPRLSAPERVPRAAVNLPKSNMMVKPEPGGVKMGVQAVFGEEAPPEARKAMVNRREGWREVKLQSRPMTSKYGSQGVSSEGSGFKPIEHKVLAKPKREVADKEIEGATGFQTVKKTDKAAENLVASALDPEIVVEKPFWTEDRALRVGGSALIALAGFAYLLSAGGVFAMRKPERGEGEL
ncbi:MAG: hypothetical protein PHS14_12355 [Elusimicrobia bacterium]|nr:hypothetical protein [Elusimicrobiota bacterium]